MNHDQHRIHEENKAIDLVARGGVEAVSNRLAHIHQLGEERYDYFAQTTGVPFGWTSFDYLSEDEKYERHLLTLGLALCTDPQAEARARVLARREEQRRAREMVKHALVS